MGVLYVCIYECCSFVMSFQHVTPTLQDGSFTLQDHLGYLGDTIFINFNPLTST